MDTPVKKQRSANDHTIVIERHLDHPPHMVFFAYSDPQAKAAWFRGPPDWDIQPHHMDFRVGGREVSAGGPKGGFVSTYDSTFLEIVPDERIINAFSMNVDGKIITASLATTQFRASGTGTDIRLIEQIVFLDGADHLEQRIEGTSAVFDMLGDWLDKQGARA